MPNNPEYYQQNNPEYIASGLKQSPDFGIGMYAGETHESNGGLGKSFLKSVPSEFRSSNSSPTMSNIENTLSW